MNYIDIIVVGLVFWAMKKGFSKGLIKELISCVALILGIYIAINFSVFITGFLIDVFPSQETFISTFSFLIVFLLGFLFLKIAAVLISKLAQKLYLGTLNKLLGAIFGGIKVTLILAVILFEVSKIEKTIKKDIIPKNQKQTSFVYKPIIQIVPKIAPTLKKELNNIHKFIDE